MAAQGSTCSVVVTQDPDLVRTADRIVLPGQGAMPDCIKELKAYGLMDAVLEAARNKPLLGVCVGMQMLLTHSAEGVNDEGTPALDLIPGNVLRFAPPKPAREDAPHLKVPHMGWNQVSQIKQNGQTHPLWQGIPDESYFYFVHSFYAQPLNERHVASTTDYGTVFTSAILKENLFATQFHPEKSAAQGLQLYQNFLNWTP